MAMYCDLDGLQTLELDFCGYYYHNYLYLAGLCNEVVLCKNNMIKQLTVQFWANTRIKFDLWFQLLSV